MKANNIRLFHHIHTSSFFYKQMDGVAVRSVLSPVIASFFTGDFEEMALSRATCKFTCWFFYVDDTFVI